MEHMHFLFFIFCLGTHPMPHSPQQVRRSSAEICRLIFAPLKMHNLSDMASTAPKAWGEKSKQETAALEWGSGFYNALGLSFGSTFNHRADIIECDLILMSVHLTQQEPQDPWSLICWIVVHLGHCWRASKVSGSLVPLVTWTLIEKKIGGHRR